ncbi:MAG: argininosuccinate synthase [Clostridiales bacterium]|nr:argininosuccinate synthase [Clostridiales bacterium]MDD7386511.1 argininosuccinate synthase [Bacillota bacterium]MDY6040926.1 argininosuccinate synthase [Candidatus Faecousia sp.]
MDKKEIKKVVLAYSGGLDTSIIIPWLKENYNNPEIIAVAGNVGQADELEGLEAKALATGASKLIVADLVDEMVDEIIIPSLKMDAKYETYLLGTAFARPVIGRKLAQIALEEGADAIVHGATGKGNDQVRFELAIKRFAPDMKIIAPWREWDIKSRDEEIDYAEAHHVPLKISRETNYSKDKNLWHLSHEGLDLEDPANEPNLDKPGFLEMGVSPYAAPDGPTYVTLDFEAGAPVAINGEKMKASKIIEKLNELGGANGIGIIDIVENRLVGMKDRGVYETPGGTILYFAHQQLEMITVDKDTLHLKQKLAVDYADLIYNGKWFSPLQEALTAFANKANEHVTGTVKLKLYKGNIIPAGMTSPYSLYSEKLVTFGESDYDQGQAAGFINLWGLSTKVQALQEQGKL